MHSAAHLHPLAAAAAASAAVQVSSFPLAAMFGMCAFFLLVCLACQRQFASIVHYEQVGAGGVGWAARCQSVVAMMCVGWVGRPGGVPHRITFELSPHHTPTHAPHTHMQAGTHFDEDVHRGAEAGGSKAAGAAEPTELSKLVGGSGDASAASASPAKPTAAA